MMNCKSTAALKSYRRAISDAWLPIVGRRRLTATEYGYVKELFASRIEVETVLRAIRRCAARALGANYTIYSLGVIKSDLGVIMKENSRMRVGAGQPNPDAWREQWRRDLTDLIGYVNDPFKSAYQSLLADLDSLSLDGAMERWRAIQQLPKEL
jgi:hypothetical protein